MLLDWLQINFFPLWRAYLVFCGFAVEFARYMWTVAISRKKKLWIRKYPDTCGQGLKVPNSYHRSAEIKSTVNVHVQAASLDKPHQPTNLEVQILEKNKNNRV